MEQAANGSWSALDAFCVDAERATLPPDDHVPILLWHWRTVQALPGREDGPTLLDRAAERVAQRLDLALPAALTLEGWGFPAEAARFDTQGAAAGSPVRVQCLGRQLQAANRDRDLGRLLQASQALLALGPDNPDLLNNVAYARLALNPGDTNAAREVEDARRAFPQSVWLQATHAWVLHLQGRRAESLEAYEQLDPVTLQSPQVRLRCAEARLSTGLTNGVPELLLPVRDELLFPEERPALQHLRDALRAPSTP
jgi:hypothetical protein